MKQFDRGANRSQTMTKERGFKGSSHGPAGPTIRFRDLDQDTRSTLRAMIAQGIHPERIAAQTGAPLAIIRAMAELVER